jgi:Tfp pilus assembly protein PilF
MSVCHYHLGLAYLRAGDAERGRASLRGALTNGTLDNAMTADIRKRLDGPH